MELTQPTVQKASPRDVFLHLLVIITLYASATAFLTLLFQYINFEFPDIRSGIGNQFYREGLYQAIRIAIATLVVSFPAYIIASWFLNRISTLTPEKRNIRIRKWLLYFTLFIAALIVLGDFVTLIYNLLNGEASASFFLKVLAVFFVAGSVFLYYFWDLHKAAIDKTMRVFSYCVVAIVFAAIIAGFFVVGSPSEKRDRDLDAQRVGDLQEIQSAVVQYWQSKGKLPENLDVLTDPLRYVIIPIDPQTKEAYGYEVSRKAETFKLCATFKYPTNLGDNITVAAGIKPQPNVVDVTRTIDGFNTWDHGSGRVCFERTIDKDFFEKKPSVPLPM